MAPLFIWNINKKLGTFFCSFKYHDASDFATTMYSLLQPDFRWLDNIFSSGCFFVVGVAVVIVSAAHRLIVFILLFFFFFLFCRILFRFASSRSLNLKLPGNRDNAHTNTEPHRFRVQLLDRQITRNCEIV